MGGKSCSHNGSWTTTGTSSQPRDAAEAHASDDGGEKVREEEHEAAGGQIAAELAEADDRVVEGRRRGIERRSAHALVHLVGVRLVSRRAQNPTPSAARAVDVAEQPAGGTRARLDELDDGGDGTGLAEPGRVVAVQRHAGPAVDHDDRARRLLG